LCCFVSIVVLCGQQWFQMAKTRQKQVHFDVISQIFLKQVSADSHNVRFRRFYFNHFTLSNCCKHKSMISQFHEFLSQFHEFLSQFFGGFLKFDLTVRVGEGRGFNKRGWVWHAHGVHATPKGYVLEGRRLLLPWVNKRFTVVEDRYLTAIITAKLTEF